MFGEDGLTVISVANISNAKRAESFVRGRMKRVPYDFILLVGGWKVYQKYRGRRLPSTYLIDKKGMIRFYHREFNKGLVITIEQEIRALLAESI